MNDKNEQQIGAAIYVEEIVFTGKQTGSFDRQDSRMV